jgi:methylmalonyl-CoA epimerase
MPRVIRVNHIGIATSDAESAERFLVKGLGLETEATEDVPGDAVRVSFLPIGESRLEILEPVGDAGPVQSFIEKRGQGIHHICLEVEDLAGMLVHLRHQGVKLLDEEPRAGAHGTLVAFLHPKSTNGVLIELVESSSLVAHRV